MKIFYSKDYVAAGESFDTMQKSQWIVEALKTSAIDAVEVVEPARLSVDDIARVHSLEYVEAVRTGEPREVAQSQGFTWDPGLWRSVSASNGGVVAAAMAAMSDGTAGSLSSGLHHARRSNGSGFCTFNGLVIAANAALDAGAESVLILDLDAHCGGGTHSLIEHEDRIRHVDVSVSSFDCYDASNKNTLDILHSPSDYLRTIEHRITAIDIGSVGPSLCIYNAGMDPDERCRIGGLRGINSDILRQREETVFTWAHDRDIPIAFVLAGGYCGGDLTRSDLIDLHLSTIRAACLQFT